MKAFRDRALAKAEGFLRMRALKVDHSRDRLRLGVVFVAWDETRTRAGLSKLEEALAQIERLEVVGVVVANNPALTPSAVAFDWISGTNSDAEFSGYQEGLERLERSSRAFDCLALVNDRFDSYSDDYIASLDACAVASAAQYDLVVGRPDELTAGSEALGHRLGVYCRSNFMIMGSKLVGRTGTPLTVQEEDLNSVLPSSWNEVERQGLLNVSAAYSAFMLAWLSGTDHSLPSSWYGARQLSADGWPLLRQKAKSILNEHLLSARLVENGGVIISPEEAQLLGRISDAKMASEVAKIRRDPRLALRFRYSRRRRLAMAWRALTGGGGPRGGR